MITVSYSSSDEFQRRAYASILEHGIQIAPRGLVTLEIGPVLAAFPNPRARLTFNPARRWSMPLAIAELCWHARGDTDLEPLTFYAPSWKNYSDDKRSVLGSCYGRKIFGTDRFRRSRWENVKTLLRSDPSSQRAVIPVFDSNTDVSERTRDVSCTLSFQFLIRDNRLDMICNMRSNDIFLGFPYDFFLFTMLQEVMSRELDVPLGTYFHSVGSLHLYARDIARVRRILSEPAANNEELGMEPIDQAQGLYELASREIEIRLGLPKSKMNYSKYWSDLECILSDFCFRRESVDL